MKPEPQEKTQDAQPGLLHPVVMRIGSQCEALTREGMNHPAAQCQHRALPKKRFCKKHLKYENRKT
jgi:hypothetical protein